MTRMGIIEDFLNSTGQYNANGLSEAFNKGSLSGFPIHDPIARLSKKSNEEFSKKYSRKTGFWTCFWLKNVCLIYEALFFATLVVLMIKIFSR